MVVDVTVYELYGHQIDRYFAHQRIALTVFPVAKKRTKRCGHWSGSSTRSTISGWCGPSRC